MESLKDRRTRKPEECQWGVPVQCITCKQESKVYVNPDDYIEYASGSRKRMIQDIFPYLTADEREMLMSSMCGKCYDKLFNE